MVSAYEKFLLELSEIPWTAKLLLPLEMINRFIFVPFGPPLERIDILPAQGVSISIGADGPARQLQANFTFGTVPEIYC